VLGSCLGLGLDCDSMSHSCDSCIDFSCFWCQGESSSNSFCTSNPNVCVSGSLFEDSLFCPKSEPSFESLEWWGENAFFSRASDCTSFSTSCVRCLTQLDTGPCGYCETASLTRCKTRGVVLPDASCGNQAIACLLSLPPVANTDEETLIVLDVDSYILAPNEVNSTTTPTYTVMNVQFSPSPNISACQSWVWPDSGDDFAFTPGLDYNGRCDFTVTATSIEQVYGLPTRISFIWSVNVNPVNDVPVFVTEQTESAKIETITASFTLDFCKMFTDADHDPLTPRWLSSASNVVDLSAPPGTCDCGSGHVCPVSVTQYDNGEGDLQIWVEDGQTQSTQQSFHFTSSGLNHAPVCSPPSNPIVVTVSENRDPLAFSLDEVAPTFDFCTDVDGDSLTWTLTNEIAAFVKSISIDSGSGLISVELDGVHSGSATSTITVTDSHGASAHFGLSLTVTAENDLFTWTDMSQTSFVGESFFGDAQHFDMSQFVFDEESSFATNTLVCTAAPDNGADSAFASVTIVKGIGTITFLAESSGDAPWTISCSEPATSQPSQQFSITITTKFTNSMPQSITAFGTIDSYPAASPYTFPALLWSTYFKDNDTARGQVLTVWPDAAPAGMTFTNTSTQLTIALLSGTAGKFSVLIWASDGIETISQNMTIIAYKPSACPSITENWNNVNPFVLDLAARCGTFVSLTAVWTESTSSSNTLAGKVTVTMNGSNVTFVTDACNSGKYSGYLTVTDDHGRVQSPVPVTLTASPSGPTIQNIASAWFWLVVKKANDPYTGYNGSSIIIGGPKVKVPLQQMIKSCGSIGGITYSQVGSATIVTHYGPPLTQSAISTDFDGPNFVLEEQATRALTHRSWTLTASIMAKHGNDTATFSLAVSKLWCDPNQSSC